MDKRLNIGLMIHHLENDYSKAVVKGAAEAAEVYDVNIVFYPGRSLGGDYYDRKHTVFEYQNNVLYNFVSPEALDGVIISAGTLGQFISKEEFKSFIDQYEGMPVLTLENEVRGYPCLRFGAGGIKQIIGHLCSEHGCKNIAFVSGPKNNDDAKTRLAAYREAMLENGLDYDESMIAYGNFSEYTVDIVEKLIDNCGRKLDAICFANDQMCIGGYTAARNKGLEPGKDIIITGYDDSEVAQSLSPALTTVKADASVLGYTAVKKMVKLLAGGEELESEELQSGIVIRNSCGCESIFKSSSKLEEVVRGMTNESAARTIVNILAGSEPGKKSAEARKQLADFFTRLFDAASSGGELHDKKLALCFENVLNEGITDYINHDTVFNIISAAEKYCLSLAAGSHNKEIKVYSLFDKINRCLSNYIIGWYYGHQADNALCTFLIGNIAKDMIMYMEDEEQCFNSISNNLHRLHIRSTYVYEYEKPIINPSNSQWTHPEHLMLKAYHIGDDLYTLKREEQMIGVNEYLHNRYSPEGVRRTMVLAALFSNEEQYGLMLCDLDPEYFPFIYSSAPQVCMAIKLTGLIKRLEGSLMLERNANTMLNKISVSDELTGIYNRRGFYQYANEEIQKAENSGRTGVLIFGDLDNLKKINDNFGHDDGDYAIKTAASYIKGCLGGNGVPARIGGDEFAALTVIDGTAADAAKFRTEIKSAAAEHNKTSSKTYNVCMSVGIYTFECGRDADIRKYMDKADSALYADKKNKSPEVMKVKEDK